MTHSPYPIGEKHHAFWSKVLPADQCYVYFIQGDEDSPIKIGYTANVKSRMRALQTGTHETLRLLALIPAEKDVEASYHREVDHCRVLNEWFKGGAVDRLLSRAIRIADEMMIAHDGSSAYPDIYCFDPTLVRPKPSSFMERAAAGVEERRKKREQFAKENPDYQIPWAGRIPEYVQGPVRKPEIVSAPVFGMAGRITRFR